MRPVHFVSRPFWSDFRGSCLLAVWFGSLILPLTGQVPPSISVQPAPFTKIVYGGAMNLLVTANGEAPLRYQWWHDGQVVPGATNFALSTNAASSTSSGATFALSGVYWLVVTNSFGTTTSSNAVVEVSALPWITQQPISQAVAPTQSAIFTVQAQGIGANTPKFGFQWYKDDVAIPNANGSTLVIKNAGLIDQGNYHAVVGAFFGGTVQSSNATLTISRAPTAGEKLPQITGLSSPFSGNANEGTSATFKVSASGWKPLTFQWRLNGNVIPGATNEVYLIPALSTNQSGIYSIVVNNAYGTVSQSTTFFTVNSLHQPNDFFANRVSLRENSGTVYTPSLFATVEADEPPPRLGVGGHSLWWTWTAPASGVATFDGSFSQFSAVVSLFHGDTLKTLTPAEQTSPYNSVATIQVDAGETVQVSVDSFYATVGYASPLSIGQTGIALNFLQDISPNEPPSITSDLAATNLSAGDTLKFSITSAGTHPIHTQWLKDGTPLPHFTGTNLVITNIQASDVGSYSVTLTNRYGSATSTPVAVTVSPSPPIVVSSFSNLWVTEGYPLLLQVAVKGTSPMSYQWSLEGNPLFGETNPVLAKTATPSLSGHYRLSISNSFGATNLPNVLVSVLPSPVRYQWSTLAGSAGQYGVADGHGSSARFWYPSGIAQNLDGNLVIADAGSGNIRLMTPTGDVSTIVTGFKFPVAVKVETDGSILIVDQQSSITYRLFADGLRTALSGGDWGVAVGQDGSVYQLVGQYGIQQFKTNGTFQILVRNLSAPVDGTFDTSGNFYIAEAGGATIRKLSPDGILTVMAGKSGVYSAADGPVDSALFFHPNSVSFDGEGNLFIADEFESTIRKIDTQGIVTTVGGLYPQSGSSDGTGADARFFEPRRVLATREGLLYVVDTDNHTIRVGTPVPVLTASFPAGMLQLTWPQSPIGFVLETATSPALGSGWTIVSSGIESDGHQWKYSESATEGQRYYRLRHP